MSELTCLLMHGVPVAAACWPVCMQIENKQYVGKIEDLNEELLKLKSTTGRTVKVGKDLGR